MKYLLILPLVLFALILGGLAYTAGNIIIVGATLAAVSVAAMSALVLGSEA